MNFKLIIAIMWVTMLITIMGLAMLCFVSSLQNPTTSPYTIPSFLIVYVCARLIEITFCQ